MEFDKTEKDIDKAKFKYYGSFHQAIGPLLLVSKFFALMPLVNTTNPNPNKIRFRYKSFGMIFACTFLLCGSLFTLLFTKHTLAIGVNPKNIVGVVFYVCGLTSCCLFLSLAQKWPNIIAYWTNIEIIFLKEPYKMPKQNLSRKIRISAIIIAVLAAVEHGLYLSSTISNFKHQSENCNNTMRFTLNNFLLREFQHIYKAIPYSIVTGIPVLVLNIIFTIIWNFVDFFIMMISIGISTRLGQLNDRLDRISDKYIPENIWTNIRNDYVKLLELLEYIDEQLASIILLSSMNNLYFICVQLLNIFNPLRLLINKIYFWYSLLYLIGRTTFIFLCAATINDESKIPLKTLRKVPSEGWNTEVERFISDISNQCIALSGMKFFYLTRKILFGMAGTIVSYELVLLQFDEKSRLQGVPPLCG